MELNNPLYKNQGIHLISTIFTVDNGVVKVLLIKRKNKPYKDMWALVGGALYNNEEVEYGLRREILEKTGISDIDLYFSDVFSKVDRSPLCRMIALSYIGFIDYLKISFLKETLKTSNAMWFDINKIPDLAYDHNDIFYKSLDSLRELVNKTDILKSLFTDTFTIPELQNVYETILNKRLDRRNFRKKLLNDNLIVDTYLTKIYLGNKPAKLYKFR